MEVKFTFGPSQSPDRLLNVETSFDEFIRAFGGEVVSDLLPKHHPRDNADFLFRKRGVVVELKRLVENKREDAQFQSKITELAHNWMDRRLIGPIYGRVQINSKDLPEICQRELLEIYKRPVQRRIQKANRQIKATADEFCLDKPKGMLIIVNDDNLALEPDGALYLIGRALGSAFRLINSVIFCTVNRLVSIPGVPHPALIWVHATRAAVPAVDQLFVDSLHAGWCSYIGHRRGDVIRRVEFDASEIAAGRNGTLLS